MEARELERYLRQIKLDKAVLKEAAREDKIFNELLGHKEVEIGIVERLLLSKTKNDLDD